MAATDKASSRAGRLIQRYLVPGFVFQAVVIGGGYGTGRELVEFFLSLGPIHGLFAMATATIVWGVVLAFSFEIARSASAYDYRAFLRTVLGRAWGVYELLYIAFMVLVISIIGAASGTMIQEMTGAPAYVGTIGCAALIALLLYVGSDMVERIVAAWGLLLYIFFLVLVLLCFARFGDAIGDALGGRNDGNWLVGGVRYAAYNIGIVPAILFSVRHIETRGEALASGALAGVIGMAPAVFIYLAMLSQYPAVLAAPIPANVVLAALGSPLFQTLFQVVLLGAFVDTGLGLIHGLNERIANALGERGRRMNETARAMIGIAVLLVSIVVAAQVGVIALIADGYGMLTWGFLLVFVLPVLVVGVRRLTGAPSPGKNSASFETERPGQP